jgi:hypothetical protein
MAKAPKSNWPRLKTSEARSKALGPWCKITAERAGAYLQAKEVNVILFGG